MTQRHDDEGDEYPEARSPRGAHGCPACGANVAPTRSKDTWPSHSAGGVLGADKCDLSGKRVGFETDRYFRTFVDRETPILGSGEDGYYKTSELEPFGDAIGVVNRLIAPSERGESVVAAQVRVLITKADYARLRDELGRMARELGWA